MATKLGSMLTNLEGLLPMMLVDPLITWSCKIMRQTKNISTTTVPIATEFGAMAT